jgi:hypothetical protein
MPARYEGIKRSLRKEHPNWSDHEIKKHAAMIYNGTKKKGEESLQHHDKSGR